MIGWAPIATAPRDRWIWIRTDSRPGLPVLVRPCRWHPDAGFTVCEIREPIEWHEMPMPELRGDCGLVK